MTCPCNAVEIDAASCSVTDTVLPVFCSEFTDTSSS